MELSLEFVSQFMLQNFDQTKVTNNGTQFLARCILCGDSKKNPYKKRFNLQWNNGVPGWHCFNCDRSGNFIEIYSIVKGLSYDDAKLELFRTWKNKETVKKDIKRKRKAVDNPKTKKERSDDNFNWIFNNCYGYYDRSYGMGILESKYIKHLQRFYKTRKIPKEYALYICYKGKYMNRIIIPILDKNDNIIYFQARRIPGTGLMPKYDNPVAPKELCILNKDKFNKDKHIIVQEGLIDSMMVEDNQGTSCLGKEISENLLEELFKLTNKNVIIALDNDTEAYKSLSRFMKKNKYSKKVKYFLYPPEFKGHDDINSFVRDSNTSINVYEIITQNSVNYSTALVKLKIKGIM